MSPRPRKKRSRASWKARALDTYTVPAAWYADVCKVVDRAWQVVLTQEGSPNAAAREDAVRRLHAALNDYQPLSALP